MTMLSWLLCSSLLTLSSQAACPDDATASFCGPENVNVIFDNESWTIFTSWDDAVLSGTNKGLIYDVEVLYTDDLKKLHSEAIEVRSDQTGTQHLWSWRSPLPLECTTHAVRLRSRRLNNTSRWSPLKTNPGKVGLSKPEILPKDPRVEVGRKLTLCCLTTDKDPVQMYFNGTRTVTRMGNHSYAMTVDIQAALPYCTLSASCKTTKQQDSSTCVYAGYPPDDRDLECETRSLESVECHWNIGRPTQMVVRRKTTYTLNGRSCPEKGKTTSNCIQTVDVSQGEMIWRLEAKNPLGVAKIQETADLLRRVWMLAPLSVEASEVNARDVRLDWQWEPLKYKTLDMLCQVQLEHAGHVEMKNYSGPGLVSVVVTDLTPAQTYTVKVRCGTVKHFWKWGDTSKASVFLTRGDIPDVLDVWMHNEQNQTVIAWNALLANQSHGQILDYEVVWGKSGDHSRERRTVYPSSTSRRNYYTLPSVVSGEEYVVTVTARNLNGSSLPSSVTFPGRFPDGMVTTKVFGDGCGFNLTWNASLSASGGYVVDWCPTSRACSVEWVKVPAGVTRARIQSAKLEECVRYTISIYACTSQAPQLLERREGYVNECIPQDTAKFTATQNNSHVHFSWIAIPLELQTAFIHRYILTYYDDPETTISISTDSTENSLTIPLEDLHRKSYQFTLKALTSLGVTNGKTITVNLDLQNDQIILVILLSLGALLLFSSFSAIVCYRNRRWLKQEFYPNIPKPALKMDWFVTTKAYRDHIFKIQPRQSIQLDISPVNISLPQEDDGEAFLSSSEVQYRQVDVENMSYNLFAFPAAEMELSEEYQTHRGLVLQTSPQEVSMRGEFVGPAAEMELSEEYQTHRGLVLQTSPQEVSMRGEFVCPAAEMELSEEYQTHRSLVLQTSPQEVSMRGEFVGPAAEMELSEEYQTHEGLVLQTSPQEVSVRGEFVGPAAEMELSEEYQTHEGLVLQTSPQEVSVRGGFVIPAAEMELSEKYQTHEGLVLQTSPQEVSVRGEFVGPSAEMELNEEYQTHEGLVLQTSPQEVSVRGEFVGPAAEMELSEEYQTHEGLVLSPSPQEVSVRGEFVIPSAEMELSEEYQTRTNPLLGPPEVSVREDRGGYPTQRHSYQNTSSPAITTPAFLSDHNEQ